MFPDQLNTVAVIFEFKDAWGETWACRFTQRSGIA